MHNVDINNKLCHYDNNNVVKLNSHIFSKITKIDLLSIIWYTLVYLN